MDEKKNNKKKVIAISVISVVIIMLIVGVTYFIRVNEDLKEQLDTANQEEQKLVLSEQEQKVYDIIIKSINAFHDPLSVRVISGNSIYGVKISASNKIGGTVTKNYSIITGTLKAEGENQYETLYVDREPDDQYYIDVSKINKAIDNYWKEKGLK